MKNFKQHFCVYVLCSVLILCLSNVVDGKVCRDIDARNEPFEIERQLRNCTIVLGSVSITLIEKEKYTTEINNLTFPALT